MVPSYKYFVRGGIGKRKLRKGRCVVPVFALPVKPMPYRRCAMSAVHTGGGSRTSRQRPIRRCFLARGSSSGKPSISSPGQVQRLSSPARPHATDQAPRIPSAPLGLPGSSALPLQAASKVLIGFAVTCRVSSYAKKNIKSLFSPLSRRLSRIYSRYNLQAV
jgi:hypothetical protein